MDENGTRYSKNAFLKKRIPFSFYQKGRKILPFCIFSLEGAALHFSADRKLSESGMADVLYFHERWYILLTGGVK
ncbi:MAG: hypothetical protein SOV63_06915 [Pyramidobacter porci]|nr:hypothetical protein [Pyramidobacter porci]